MSDPANTVPTEPPTRILTLDEVAERVHLSSRTVYRAILAGDLEASQLTQRRGGWRIYESALEAWMLKRSNVTRPPRPLADVARVDPDGGRALPPMSGLPVGGRLSVGPQMGRRVA